MPNLLEDTANNTFPIWIIILIIVLAVAVIAFLIFLILHLNKKKRIQESEKKVDQKVEESALEVSSAFGGRDNIQEINSKGSRVSVLLVDPSKVDKEKINSNLDSVMYMGNKVVFVIGEKSDMFKKLLDENIEKQNVTK